MGQIQNAAFSPLVVEKCPSDELHNSLDEIRLDIYLKAN
ncbi:hypothetical protein VIBNISO65_260005 [Vibrio nigripulchritudo SO65]|nr:hypothetical protein VIBNIAM115_430005 [Vibrio nigripulchritudo AM115]CCN41650.1 hypothetical protein VIBNIFTn2_1640089 [Vibrio nigripulchritudo FTn2]CCN64936.1 hypothetical protein VIBNIPon4_300005 [Vibrio nigripulchritudo POn4]CCN77497.1 hypothetical protein VIBNISO65_260005 [Vibrio nigripulchritudo SO65]